MNKAVFLDRDGVLNRSLVRDGKPYAPTRIEDFEINPEIVQLQRLRDAGYLLIVVTNQPDIANGLVTRAFIDQLHTMLNATVAFDEIIVCPHSNHEGCDCRKPKPGMLFQARDRHGITMAHSFMVGDRWRDVLAGQAAGCKTVFIDGGYHEDAPAFNADYVCQTLGAAIDWMLHHASH